MPYIPRSHRDELDRCVEDIVEAVQDADEALVPGSLNYIFSRVTWELFRLSKNYFVANNLIGVLECVKQEFYRRQLAPYEDTKIKEHGDL